MTQKNSQDIHIVIEPGGKQLTACRGELMIHLLAANGIYLRSDCGGNGVCGKCAVEVAPFPADKADTVTACTYRAEENLTVKIPESSIISAHVLKKADVALPASFASHAGSVEGSCQKPGVAVDLGTTTIAVYLCDMTRGTVISTIALKNPQSLCGNDVMSRIGYICKNNEGLTDMQRMVTGVIAWGIRRLLQQSLMEQESLQKMVVVGNPTMIHIFSGVTPSSIGVAPYKPAFYEPRCIPAQTLSVDLPEIAVHTFPQISGFIGGDVIAAAIGTELQSQASGTLLIDLGTNGELMLIDNGNLYATSCATGPAFEGGTLSCGIQAIPGAIDRVWIVKDGKPHYSLVSFNGAPLEKPIGICGSGIISAVATFLSNGIIDHSGRYNSESSLPELIHSENGDRFIFSHGSEIDNEISISQKDIRSLQLGKAAIRAGIELLLGAAGRTRPGSIIVAGAFGSHIDKQDLLTLGMVPEIDLDNIHIAGNSAGAGAIMALCDDHYEHQAETIAGKTNVVQLNEDPFFQELFISHLGF